MPSTMDNNDDVGSTADVLDVDVNVERSRASRRRVTPTPRANPVATPVTATRGDDDDDARDGRNPRSPPDRRRRSGGAVRHVGATNPDRRAQAYRERRRRGGCGTDAGATTSDAVSRAPPTGRRQRRCWQRGRSIVGLTRMAPP
jgi:hypothetical protein